MQAKEIKQLETQLKSANLLIAMYESNLEQLKQTKTEIENDIGILKIDQHKQIIKQRKANDE